MATNISLFALMSVFLNDLCLSLSVFLAWYDTPFCAKLGVGSGSVNTCGIRVGIFIRIPGRGFLLASKGSPGRTRSKKGQRCIYFFFSYRFLILGQIGVSDMKKAIWFFMGLCINGLRRFRKGIERAWIWAWTACREAPLTCKLSGFAFQFAERKVVMEIKEGWV